MSGLLGRGCYASFTTGPLSELPAERHTCIAGLCRLLSLLSFLLLILISSIVNLLNHYYYTKRNGIILWGFFSREPSRYDDDLDRCTIIRRLLWPQGLSHQVSGSKNDNETCSRYTRLIRPCITRVSRVSSLVADSGPCCHPLLLMSTSAG